MTVESSSGGKSAPRTIAITGATGLIGGALVRRLRARGDTVRRLVRGRATEPTDVVWDPSRGALDPAALAGVDAVVHLAGEPIAHRWTAERKRAIRDSRVRGTALLAGALAAMSRPPATLLSGSAIGYYGDRGEETLDETSAAGDGFLAEVTRAWEGAAAPAAAAGVRVALLRTGVVLSSDGGALAKMLPPFRLGMGGPLGDGRQWTSWIALEDHLGAIEHLLGDASVRGAVNVVAPTPVRNAELAATLGRVLGRRAVLPVPRFALELLYGEMADEAILASQRVMPRRLLESGFRFTAPTLEEALRGMLGR